MVENKMFVEMRNSNFKKNNDEFDDIHLNNNNTTNKKTYSKNFENFVFEGRPNLHEIFSKINAYKNINNRINDNNNDDGKKNSKNSLLLMMKNISNFFSYNNKNEHEENEVACLTCGPESLSKNVSELCFEFDFDFQAEEFVI
jgi:dsDNA-specific endonuclease/ATPase MutS2